MTKRIVFGLIISFTTLTGCGNPAATQGEPTAMAAAHQSDEEKAAQTLNEMLELGAKGDWKSYVERHYGEQHKFRSPADCDSLVQRFEQKWGEQLVDHLRRASKLAPVIDGDNAVFQEGDEPIFVLHRSDDGNWKFHL